MAKAKKKVPPARVTVHADALTYLRNGFDDLSKEQSRLRCIISETSVREVAQLACHANQIKALEEAICPRVAARLTALERSEKQQIEINDGIGDRLSADDGDKKRVFEALHQLRSTVLDRVSVLEQNADTVNKSIAILVDKANRGPKTSAELAKEWAKRQSFGPVNTTDVGQCDTPSMADDSIKRSQIANEMESMFGWSLRDSHLSNLICIVEKALGTSASKADDPSKIWKVSREVFFAQDGKSLDKESLSFQKGVYEQMKTIIKIVEQA